MRVLLPPALLGIFQQIQGSQYISDNQATQDFSFTSTMVKDEGESKLSEPIPAQPASEQTTSVYRRWIARLFGYSVDSSALRSSIEPVVVRSDDSDWIIVDPIKRSTPVFSDLWDPTASGDWAQMVSAVPASGLGFNLVSVDEVETTFMEPDLADRTAGSLLKWAFSIGVSEEESYGRELERMSLWGEFVASNMNSELPSYLEARIMEVSEIVNTAIEKDVLRTYPEELQPRMRRVLLAYAARNPSVGFCQGMSYLVSGLLQQSWVTDETAFNLLSVIAENVNRDYYDDDLSGLHLDLKRIEKFLFYVLKMGKIQVPLILVLVEPMMCVVTRLSPSEVSVRIFDIMFTQGKVGLFALYIAIVDLVNPAVIKAVSESESPDAATVDGIVAFKIALMDILGRNPDLLIQRAEGVLISHRFVIEQLLENSFVIEEEEKIEVVIPSTPSDVLIIDATLPTEQGKTENNRLGKRRIIPRRTIARALASRARVEEESIVQEEEDQVFRAIDGLVTRFRSAISSFTQSLLDDE